jgi:rod shape-determining protein MreD
LIITGLLLQSTVFSQLELLGVKPELMYVITILVALIDGPTEGTITGFASGLAQDFLLNQPKGLTALTLTLLGYTMGLARSYIVSESPLLPTFLVAAGTAAGVAFYQAVAFLLGQLQEPLARAIEVTVLTALYNGVLTPIIYPIVRRALETSRPRKVVRY